MIPKTGVVVSVQTNIKCSVPRKIEVIRFLCLEYCIVNGGVVFEMFERPLILFGDAPEFLLFGFFRFDALGLA